MPRERHGVGDATGARSGPLAKIAVYYTAHLARCGICSLPAFVISRIYAQHETAAEKGRGYTQRVI